LVGAILAVNFAQIWWAREAMAEPALGAFAWLGAWAAVRWGRGGEPRWASLAALAGVAALFTRADGVLVAGAIGLTLLAWRGGPALTPTLSQRVREPCRGGVVGVELWGDVSVGYGVIGGWVVHYG